MWIVISSIVAIAVLCFLVSRVLIANLAWSQWLTLVAVGTVVIGGFFLAGWIGWTVAKRFGLCCPHCGTIFISIDLGDDQDADAKCDSCGEMMFEKES
ncbi:MAG: hypothetical protein AAGK09_12880 [Planctomycetota bacterium]